MEIQRVEIKALSVFIPKYKISAVRQVFRIRFFDRKIIQRANSNTKWCINDAVEQSYNFRWTETAKYGDVSLVGQISWSLKPSFEKNCC